MNFLQAATQYTTNYSTSSSGEMDPTVALVIAAFYLLIVVVAVASMWKVFVKAGKPGWAAIVPIYNTYTLLQIVGRPTWWILLLFVPIAQLVVLFLVAIDLAKAFGKSTMFGVFGLALFPFVGYPMLGFGKATYNGAQPTDLTATTEAPVVAPVIPPTSPAPPTPPMPPTPPTPPAA